MYDRKAAAGVRALPVVKLVDNADAEYRYVANEGSVLTFKTNLNAPRYRCAVGHDPGSKLGRPAHP